MASCPLNLTQPLPANIASGFKVAIKRFNEGLYFDAHEVLEAHCWLGLPLSADKLFFQGLIQLCAAFVHWEKGNAYGFHKKLSQAYQKLEGVWVLYGKPPHLAGIELTSLLEQMKSLVSQKTLPLQPLILSRIFND